MREILRLVSCLALCTAVRFIYTYFKNGCWTELMPNYVPNSKMNMDSNQNNKTIVKSNTDITDLLLYWKINTEALKAIKLLYVPILLFGLVLVSLSRPTTFLEIGVYYCIAVSLLYRVV